MERVESHLPCPDCSGRAVFSKPYWPGRPKLDENDEGECEDCGVTVHVQITADEDSELVMAVARCGICCGDRDYCGCVEEETAQLES